MHQRLELPRLFALIPDNDTRTQIPPSQRNAVYQPKLKRPRLPALLTQIAGRQPEVQLHGVIARTAARRFGRRLAQELPARRAREAVLWQLGGRCMLGRCAEDLWQKIDVSLHPTHAIPPSSPNLSSNSRTRYIKKDKQHSTTYRKHKRHPAPNSLTPIRLGPLAQPQLLVTRAILPADDRRAKQQYLDALAAGKHGRHAVVGVRDCHLGLWG